MLGLLALVGCNQVFGNHAVEQDPNPIFDAPLDAPFRCTEIGTSPEFSPLLHQYGVLNCTYYAEVGGEAIGLCNNEVEVGPIGGELQPAVGIITDGSPDPRLSPDGSYMLVGGNFANRVDLYRRNGDWTLVGSTGLDSLVLGNIIHVGGADRILETEISEGVLKELVFDGNLSWTPIATHDASELGVTLKSAWLTSDGLRLVGGAGEPDDADGGHIYYSDRASIGDSFRTADKLEIPMPPIPAMTDDCARIYMTGLGSVFFAQRL
jgi:hypothetical protein